MRFYYSLAVASILLSASASVSSGFTPATIAFSRSSSTTAAASRTALGVAADVSTADESSTSSSSSPPSKSIFLTPELAESCSVAAGGTPLYAYSLSELKKAADECLAFPNAYGLTVRYAMKASPNKAILKYFSGRGIHIDASSGYEVRASSLFSSESELL